MTDRKISELVAVTSVDDADEFVLARSGSSNKVTAANMGLGGGGAVLTVTVPLDNDQILALPGTDVELIAAPGLAKMIVPITAYLVTDFAVAYGGIDANTDYPALWVAHATSPIFLTEFIDQPADEGGSSLTPFLTGTNEFGRIGVALLPLQSSTVPSNIGTAVPSAYFDPDTQANVSLKIGADNSINFTGGDAANTLVVTVLYTVLDV